MSLALLNRDLSCWFDFHTLVFDFDGIFTNNKVYLNQRGEESIRCDRGDGLGLDMLRAFISKYDWNLDMFILSKELNPVVSSRAKKLKIKCNQGISNKLKFINEYLLSRFGDVDYSSSGLIYLGNDLNDLESIIFSGFSACPIDSHSLVKDQVNLVIDKKGGEGFVREFIEKLISLDTKTVNEINDLIK